MQYTLHFKILTPLLCMILVLLPVFLRFFSDLRSEIFYLKKIFKGGIIVLIHTTITRERVPT